MCKIRREWLMIHYVTFIRMWYNVIMEFLLLYRKDVKIGKIFKRKQ